MSKKYARQRQKPGKPQRKGHSRQKVMVTLALLLIVTIIIATQWRRASSVPARMASTSLPAQPQTSSTPQLSKEYIYAGGRLIATEEPTNPGAPPTLSAPVSLTALGASLPGHQVTLSWPASTSSEAHHYQVERCSNITVQNCYLVVEANVPAAGSTITYIDTITNNPGVRSYLYRVRAANSSNTGFSDYTVDLATTISFEDDPLNPQGVKTRIKETHLTELHQAINALRVLAGLTPATWTDPSPLGVKVRAAHVEELRTNLDQARSALGLSAVPYTDQTLVVGTTPIRKEHFQELRQAVK